jgi:hypothetical protein
MSKRYITFLAGVGMLIVIFGTIYAAVQQSQRSAANYPQIQMAADTAAQIDRGHDPHVASTLSPVDMDGSLAPFTIIYDQKGKVVSGSGYLGKKVPKAPLGILKDARGKDYNAVTWQPKEGVRIAAVTVAAKKYYVLSGRSLTEVEKNENKTFWLTFVGGVIAIIILDGSIAAKMVAVRR